MSKSNVMHLIATACQPLILLPGMKSYLDGSHERIITAVEELKTEISQVKSDAQSRPSTRLRIHDRSAVFRPLASRLVAIKLDAVDGLQRVVVDEISVGYGLDVCNDKRSTERRVPKITEYC